MRKVSLLLLLMFFSINANTSISSAQVASFDFLINDGELIYNTIETWTDDGSFDPFGISKQLVITTTETVIVESLSDTSVKLVKKYDNEVFASSQELNNINYNPVKNGLVFLDVDGFLLGTDNTTLDYQLERFVDKSTGERTRVINPLGADIIGIVSYYDSTDVYNFIWSSQLLGKVGSITNLINFDVVNYSLGFVVDENYVVSEVGDYQGRKTWVIEYNTIPSGYTTFIDKMEYDQESGLLLRTTFEYNINGEYFIEEKSLTSGIDLIDDGDPVVEALDDITVNSFDPITISFNVTEGYFSSYTLFQNETVVETSDIKLVLSFTVTPTSGKTSYTLEVTDKLGHKGSATVIITYDVDYVRSDEADANYPFVVFSPIIFIYLKKKYKKIRVSV